MKLVRLFFVCFAFFGVAQTAHAQVLNAMVGGFMVHCTDATGAPVFTVFNPSLSDAGHSSISPNGMRVIQLNAGGYPSIFQLFVYAHECGHHVSGDIVAGTFFREVDFDAEKKADRIGIRLMRDQLGISLSQANNIASFVRNNPPLFPFYMPGPQRAQWIVDCFTSNNDSCTSSNQQQANNSDSDSSKQGDSALCATLDRVIGLSPSGFSSLRGSRRPLPFPGWFASISLPGMGTCTIPQDTSFYMCTTNADFSEIKQKVTACIPDWDADDHQAKDGTEHLDLTKDGRDTNVAVFETRDGRVDVTVQEE